MPRSTNLPGAILESVAEACLVVIHARREASGSEVSPHHELADRWIAPLPEGDAGDALNVKTSNRTAKKALDLCAVT